MSTPYGTTLAVGTGQRFTTTNTNPFTTGSFTPVTNANLIMVTVAMGTALPTGTPSVIYDPPGDNKTMFLLNTGGTVNGTSVSIWFYYLLNPTLITGSKTVQVTFGSTTTGGKIVGVQTFSGVDTTPAATAFGTHVATTGSVGTTLTENAVSSNTNEIVFDAFAWLTSNSISSLGAGQTENWSNTSTGGTTVRAGSSRKAGAASVTMTWNKSASTSQAVAAGAVPIKPVVAAASDDVRLSFDSNWGETTGNILANGTWGHWVMVFDGSQSTNATRLKFYFNNVAQTLTFTGTIPATTPNTAYTVRLAGTAAATDFIDGILDEVRISDIARSADWIATEYKNMCGCVTFATTGSEENNPPSAVRMRGARAVAYEGAFAQTVQLKWRTGHEVEHLGFHVYREQNGQLLRVTPSLLAGSALLAGARTELTAGQRYSWWDVLPANSGPLQYWLEEIDLHGQRTWHGPIAVKSAKGRRDIAGPDQVRSVLLSKLGRGKHKGRLPGAPWQGAADAATQTPTAAQLAMQAQLAAGPAIKLGVSAEGWYRVDQPTLIAAGLDPKVDPRRLRLYADGREVLLVVTGAQDGRLEPRDTIEFYGVGLDPRWTDTRTYWLVEGQQAGQRVGGNEWRGRTQPGPASFPFTITWQPRALHLAPLRNGEAAYFLGPA